MTMFRAPPLERRRHLFLCALALACAVTVALLVWQPAARVEGAVEFQRAIGGFGLSAGSDPSWCLHTLDPRRESVCPTALKPVPGLLPYCPRETSTLSSLSWLDRAPR
jgi:hypothetical protein